MLKQAGADAESIRQLNRVLQGIKRRCNTMKNYCNPLDLGYRYQHMKEGERIAGFREGADPTLVYFKGRYYLLFRCRQGSGTRTICCTGISTPTPIC